MSGTRAPTQAAVALPTTLDRAAQPVLLATGFESRGESSTATEKAAADLYAALQARADGRLSLVVAESPTDPAIARIPADYVLWGYGDAQGLTAYLQRVTPTLLIPLSAQSRRLVLSGPIETELCALDADLAADFVLAIAAYWHGDLERAAALLKAVLATAESTAAECTPLVVHAYLYQGNLAALAEEYDAALTDYGAGLERATSPTDQALISTNQASIYDAQGDYEAALAAANLALEQDADHANAYYQRANVYRALDQVEQAQQDLDQALRLDPTHARAYASRGLLQHNANAFEDALQDYGRALEFDPWAADVYLNRGGTLATLGELDLALQDYSQALKLQPDDADALYNRGTVYAIQENYEQALQDLNRALEIRPDFPQVYGNRGLIYKELGETDAAIADLEKFIELSDNAQWRAMIEQHLAELRKQQE